MKFISWNVNGLRACLQKGFEAFFRSADADLFCIQETRLQNGQAVFQPEGYQSFWNDAQKKGYSGTAIFSRIPPLSVSYGIGVPQHDTEGRVITLEFDTFYLINCYTPNSQRDLARLSYRVEWEDAFRAYAAALAQKKPAVICGDLNVAHQEIDLKNAKSNRGNSGFTDEERGKMSQLLASGFIDSYRQLYPTQEDAYTWWSYRFRARERNIGWRIDYFLLSSALKERLEDAKIRSDIQGSDHCPIELYLR